MENENVTSIPEIQKDAKQKTSFSELFRLFRDLLLMFTLLVLFGVYVAEPVKVDGSSMLPGIKQGERILVNKWVGFNSFERGEVIVFYPSYNPTLAYVKRVIGLPGETIEMRNGVVFINGKKLNEPYLDQSFNTQSHSLEPQVIDEYHYFVMGDNRDYSSDSRYWGAVPVRQISGKAYLRFWPINEVRFISKGENSLEQ